MPYFRAEAERPGSRLSGFEPTRIVQDFNAQVDRPLSHLEYFKLCLSAHYLTCATPVPTDVDNQIRKKLWPLALPLETALEMAAWVIESRHWDFTVVTARFACGAGEWAREPVHGHLGEWFTVAAGAYGGLGQYKGEASAREMRDRLRSEIAEEVSRHAEIFASLWRAGDGLGCLKASAALAHNFGDLDRVIDMWQLDAGDPLRLGYYKLAMTPYDSERKLRYLGRLWAAGELYKSTIDGSSMALENHRHYALRKPRSLRQRPERMITTGPFFDDWGTRLAEELRRDEPALEEVVETLKDGWDRQPKTFGYGRALKGISEVFPKIITKDLARRAELEAVFRTSRDRFESRWASAALALLDDIPSRA